MSGVTTRIYSIAEVAEHKVPNSYWIVLHGYVYDVTKFADVHPGGRSVLTKASGGDASSGFDAVNHSPAAKQMLTQFCVGQLAESDQAELAAAAAAAKAAKAELPQYTMATVATKRGPSDFWFVLNNMVLDVSSFGGDHPGGPEIIKYHSGTDATVAFKNNGHSMQAVELSKSYIIGELVPQDRVSHSTFQTREWRPPSDGASKENHELKFLLRQGMYLIVFVGLLIFAWLSFLR